MKLTKLQLEEIKDLERFTNIFPDTAYLTLPDCYICNIKIDEQKNGSSAEECYFQITSQGKKEVNTNNKLKLLRLIDAQKWRLRNCEMWESYLEDGIFLEELLEDLSQYSVNFCARTMWRGKYKKEIIEIYSKLLNK
jgi:hypothetical protein